MGGKGGGCGEGAYVHGGDAVAVAVESDGWWGGGEVEVE